MSDEFFNAYWFVCSIVCALIAMYFAWIKKDIDDKTMALMCVLFSPGFGIFLAALFPIAFIFTCLTGICELIAKAITKMQRGNQ